MMNKIAFSASAVSDPGLMRTENQDSYGLSDDGRLLIVADGLCPKTSGASQSGRLAVETLKTMWNEKRPDLSNAAEIREWLRESVTRANSEIFIQRGDAKDYCTIVVSVTAECNMVYVAHVGDARAYATKQGALVALTEDHTFINFIKVQNPELYEKVIKSGAHGCYAPRLLRALGFEDSVEVDITETQLEAGDWLLLCTDGLHEFVRDIEIAQTLRASATAHDACAELLASTLNERAPDNVTIIACRF